MLFTFEEYLQGKTYGLSWNNAEKQANVLKKVFEKVSLFITNLEIFWMTNKTIIEFGFRKMKRIMQILEDVIHLGR